MLSSAETRMMILLSSYRAYFSPPYSGSIIMLL